MRIVKKVLSLGIVLHVAGTLVLVSAGQANVLPQGVRDTAAKKVEAKSVSKSVSKTGAPEGKVFDRGRWRTRNDVIRDKAKTYYDLGVNHGLSGEYEKAVADFKQAIYLKPDYADAYLSLGHAYDDLGRWQEAVEAYKQGLKFNPKDMEARHALDTAYAKLKLNKGAAPTKVQAKAVPSIGRETGVVQKVSMVMKAPITTSKAPAVLSKAPITSSPSVTSSNASVTSPNASPKKTYAATPAVSLTPSLPNLALTPNATAAKNNLESRTSASTAAPVVKDLTSFYRVGVGDVLDIRLLNATTNQSTLYTVMENGLIEYPMAGEPLSVTGLTTDEIAKRLAASSKVRAVYDQPRVAVGVRDYDSHTIIVSGLVNDPGTKVLRREAIPLYVVIADAQPRAEATHALVMSHATGQTTAIDLTDTAAMNMLVHPGDVVTVQAQSQARAQLQSQAQQFFYIGGLINQPGQKQFTPGMTLTQAILTAEGVRTAEPNLKNTKYVVAIARQDASGRLVTTKYKLEEIKQGKVPDPSLQQGDRIEINQ